MGAQGAHRRTWLHVAWFVLCGCAGAKKPAAVSGEDAGHPDVSIAADGGSLRPTLDAGAGPAGDGGPSSCQPASCESLGARCGTAQDGCGGSLDCGACPVGERCAGNACSGCVAKSCSELGWACGSGSDGCNATVDCGGCANGAVCHEHQCCHPRTCPADACGDVPDGCGGTLRCAPCASVLPSKVCGRVSALACVGPGASFAAPACSCELPFVCDPRNGSCCMPLACADLCRQGAYDGSDGCGATIHCDACPVVRP